MLTNRTQYENNKKLILIYKNTTHPCVRVTSRSLFGAEWRIELNHGELEQEKYLADERKHTLGLMFAGCYGCYWLCLCFRCTKVFVRANIWQMGCVPFCDVLHYRRKAIIQIPLRFCKKWYKVTKDDYFVSTLSHPRSQHFLWTIPVRGLFFNSNFLI